MRTVSYGLSQAQNTFIIRSHSLEIAQILKAHELGVGAYVKKPYLKEKIGLMVRQEPDRI